MNDIAEEETRVELLLQEVLRDLNDPDLELSESMRLTIRQRGLQAYLHGLRFALGEAELLPENSFAREISGFLRRGQPS